MRARRIRRPGGVDHGELLLLPHRLQRRHGRMQSEKSVQIDDIPLRNIDRRTHGVVRGFSMRHDHVQAVGRAPLEDHHQPLGAGTRLSRVHAARARKHGIAVVPTTASALLRRKTRRVIDIVHLASHACPGRPTFAETPANPATAPQSFPHPARVPDHPAGR